MPTDIQSILRIEVPMIVQIASRRMKVRDVANLSPGAIIELPKLANEELDILVSNRQIGRGTAVKVGENFGLRVTKVGDLRSRIEALGDTQAVGTPVPSSTAQQPGVEPPQDNDAGAHDEQTADQTASDQ